MAAVIAVLLSAVVILLTFLLVQLEKKRKKYDQFCGPRSLPIVGNVHQMKRSPTGNKDRLKTSDEFENRGWKLVAMATNIGDAFTRQLYEWIDKYGQSGIFRMMVGYYPLVIICKAEDAEALEWVDKYGPSGIFRVMVGYYPLIILCRAEQAEPLMNSNKHIDKSRDYEFLHPWLNTGLLTSTGDKWKIRRKLLTPTFHFKILHDFVRVFNEQTRILLKKLNTHADGKPYNIFNDITLCALDIICETAMGQSVNAQENENSEYVQAVYRASEHVFHRQRTPWYWPDFLFNLIGPGKENARCLKIMHDFTEKVIRERAEEFRHLHGNKKTMEELLDDEDEEEGIAGKRKKRAFLDMLLCTAADGRKLTPEDIREEVDTFMFEGHDTTAMASNWATHLIGTDPEVQRKVHEELDSIFGDSDSDRDATMEDLKSMHYLECCIKEALRIFPSVPVYGRSLTEDTKIGNVMLEKGSTVLVAPAGVHRDQRFFPDPDKFDPDRFLPENCVGRHPFAYIPFSAGPRNCIGQKFAMLEEKVVLATIFRNFSVKSMQERDELNPSAELILRPEKGIVVQLTPRKNQM